MRKYLMTPIIILLFLLSACTGSIGGTAQTAAESETGKQVEDGQYRSITPKDAKDIIGTEGVVLVDVRTAEEYAQGHIPQAIQLSVDDVSKNAESVIKDKEATVIVYCRSGRRSKIAAKELTGLGYKNVYDLGGIQSWPYETVGQ